MENTSGKNMGSNKVAILVCVKDRPTEIALLLQSLRTQTYKNFDVFILDDQSGTPLPTYHFFNCIITLLKMDGHKVFLKTTEFTHGVSRARQAVVDWAKDDYEYLCRVDDDVILEPDYLERLFKVLDQGYDLASGVTVPCKPTFVREPKYMNGIVNRVILNKKGEYIMNGDDCGTNFTESVILPAHHFRSCALYKSKIHKKANYIPTPLSNHGFREEQIFSYRLLMAGFKIGVDTQAINYHQMTPSGGERFPNQNELVKFNQGQFEDWTKENKDKLRELFPDEPAMSEQELMKESNLLMK